MCNQIPDPKSRAKAVYTDPFLEPPQSFYTWTIATVKSQMCIQTSGWLSLTVYNKGNNVWLRKRETEREREREKRDRQAGRHTDRQTDRQRHTGRRTNCNQADKQTDTQRDSYILFYLKGLD